MVSSLTFTAAQRARAAKALLELEREIIPRDRCNALLKGCAEQIVSGRPIEEPERIDKYQGMRLMWGTDPVMAAFLGGTRRATLADDFTEDSAAIDRDLRAQITGISELAFKEATARVAFKVANTARKAHLKGPELWSLQNETPIKFLASIRPRVRDRLFAALSVDEEDAVKKELSSAADSVEALLASASLLVVALFDEPGELGDRHDDFRPTAVDLYLTAMTARVLSRLDRYSDGDKAALDGFSFAATSSDTMAAAAGAATTAEGGLATNADSRIITTTGETFKGTGFAQGDATNVELEPLGIQPVEFFKHSGNPDGNPIHVRADGKPLADIKSRAGTTAGCNCWHETRYEEVETDDT